MNKKVVDLESLLRVPYVEPDLGYEVSPDGSRAAFSWNKSGRWEIYTLDLDGKLAPVMVSNGKGAKFAPRWSPDGKKLAYVVDLTGGEDYDILVYDFEAGVQVNVTPDTLEALTSSFAWSPDGARMAVCSDREGHFETYIFPSVGGEMRKVLDLAQPDWVVKWSPDGTWLAVVSEATASDYWVHLVGVEDGEIIPIAIDDELICAKDPAWSPNSAKVVFCSDLSGQFEIGIFDIETRFIEWRTRGEGEKEQPAWSPDGKQLSYVCSYGPRCELTVLDLESKAFKNFALEPGVIYQPTYSPDGKSIYFVFDNPRYPDDLWVFDLVEEKFVQLTFSFSGDFSPEAFRMPDEVWYPGLDGVDVPGLLYRPEAKEGLPPGVLYVHGGPNWLTQVTWDPLVQYMVSRGWAVLAPNYRGSTGYGRAWQLASRYDLGGVDTNDVVAGANYLDEEGIADPARIAVTGRSWGGYLTMTCLTKYPERWAAGSAVVPFLNWFTSHENSREDLQHWDRENFGDPEENYDLWYERSPFFFLDKVSAPVQLICGAHDVRCPASESKQAYEELKTLGKTCDYVLYPDEGHGFLKMENLIDGKKRRAEFLAMHLEEEKE